MASHLTTPVDRHRDQILYYSLYSSSPVEIPARLAGKTVCVVGLGGVGSELVRHLAVAGVGRLICIDGDFVEDSNLNRQLWYAPADVGRAKAACMARKIQHFAPDTSVFPVQAHIESLDQLQRALACGPNGQKCDFIACCADEPIGRIETICLDAAAEAGCKAGMAAMNLRRGYWAVFSDRSAAARAKLFFERAALIAESEARTPVKGSASWTNAIISAFFAEAVIALLADLPWSSSNAISAWDFDSMRLQITADFRASAMP